MPDATRQLALITGASAGLGVAFAHAYAKRGLDVALVARRQDRLEALGAELEAKFGITAYAVPQDLSVYGAELAVLGALEERGRHVDVLVNNAGLSIAQDFTGVPWERQRDLLMTMVVSATGLAHGVIPGMVERGYGRILNVASITAFAPGVAGHSLYPAVKSYAVKFSQALDAELRGKGLKVTALAPGSTESEFTHANGTEAAGQGAPKFLVQTAAEVAEAGVAGNEAGKLLVIPGLHNKLAVGMMRAIPEWISRPLILRGAQKFRLPSDGGSVR
jgi:short-subunit dehydrogenase